MYIFIKRFNVLIDLMRELNNDMIITNDALCANIILVLYTGIMDNIMYHKISNLLWEPC